MDCRYKLDYPAIARRIKTARKEAGLTQAELAERIEISTNAVAKLENDLMTPSLQTLVNIANVLHIEFDHLLSDPEGSSSPDSKDAFLSGLLQELEPQEKDFIIHVINGLKLYR